MAILGAKRTDLPPIVRAGQQRGITMGDGSIR
jgi:hypothetical protein